MRSRKWCTASAKPRVSVAVAQPNASELRFADVVTPSTVIETDCGASTSAERPAPYASSFSFQAPAVRAAISTPVLPESKRIDRCGPVLFPRVVARGVRRHLDGLAAAVPAKQVDHVDGVLKRRTVFRTRPVLLGDAERGAGRPEGIAPGDITGA